MYLSFEVSFPLFAKLGNLAINAFSSKKKEPQLHKLGVLWTVNWRKKKLRCFFLSKMFHWCVGNWPKNCIQKKVKFSSLADSSITYNVVKSWLQHDKGQGVCIAHYLTIIINLTNQRSAIFYRKEKDLGFTIKSI